jgi:hypothetical protein
MRFSNRCALDTVNIGPGDNLNTLDLAEAVHQVHSLPAQADDSQPDNIICRAPCSS